MKSRTVVITILAIIVADQILKYWVKTNMEYQEQIPLIGSWFRLFFIENEGMAWGWKFGGEWGKMALTLFRLVAVIFGVFYLRSIIRKKMHPGFIICAAMIFAGALGNLIDSLFYGLIYSASDVGMPLAKLFSPIFNIADASISIGVILLLIFQKKFFKKHPHEENQTTLGPNNPVNDTVRAL